MNPDTPPNDPGNQAKTDVQHPKPGLTEPEPTEWEAPPATQNPPTPSVDSELAADFMAERHLRNYEPPAESDFEGYDNEEERNQEILHQDHASDNEDFTRSDEDGWYYSDDD